MRDQFIIIFEFVVKIFNVYEVTYVFIAVSESIHV